MPPFLASYIARLDDAYRDRPYVVGLKARLLAAFDVMLLVFVPINMAKLFWLHLPGTPLRVAMVTIVGLAALASMRLLVKGRLDLAAGGLVLLVLLCAHAIAFGTSWRPEPLALEIQLFILDVTSLVFAVAFTSRRFGAYLFLLIVAGHVGFYRAVMRSAPITGSLAFASKMLLSEGLVALCLIFCLGMTLMWMIESAHRRSEESLRETRSVNEKLEHLVSERTRDLEAASKEAREASQAKSEFLANMSHEIRTPLNGIVASADLLVRRGDLPVEAADQARLITESGDLLMRLLGDILDFSKIEAGQLALESQPFELPSTIESTMELVASKAAQGSVALKTSVSADLPRFVEGDSFRLRQVLLNLLSNAIKFTPAGGRVCVRASTAPAFAKASAGEGAPGASPVLVRIEVRDTGIGMNAATIERIFERFTQADTSTTRRYGGTGLGLAISSRLVSMMGGRLDVSSEPGGGSVFHFTLPLRAVGTASELSGDAEAPVEPLGLRVLVVEDNAMNQRILGAQLARLGCGFSMESDGESALAALLRDPLPDAILMDCHMPVLDGWEATRRLRSWAGHTDGVHGRAAALPVIALTAAALPEEKRRCVAAGMNEFLAKPVKLADLYRVLGAIARKS